jgi:YYY domain-containing protein
MVADILIWWLIAQGLGLVGLPIAGLLFRSLPSGGYPFAKVLGLLLTGYLAWLLAMLGLGNFSAPLLLACALLIGGLGLWVWRASLAPRRSLLPGWPALLGYEIIFLAAMLAVVWMRAHDPTPWGTERPMDFAFFNAIQRSDTFPPNDPWLAGYSINYYYFGYLLMAGVAQLSGLEPSTAYNLSLALIFALTALGVAGVIVNLIALASRQQARGKRQQNADLLPLASCLFALLGAMLVLVAGNQSGAIQVVLGTEKAVTLNSRELVSAAGQALSGESTIRLPSGFRASDFAQIDNWERQDMAAPGAFNWWWPSRSLWDTYQTANGTERRYDITEFPLFSFRLGDLHPHVMSLPFTLLALTLALTILASPNAPALAVGRTGWAELLGSAVILGSLYMINSWDLPTYLLLYAGALLILQRRLSGDGPIDWMAYGRRLGLVALTSFLLFLPFYLTFRSLVGGATPLIDLPILSQLTSILGVYTASRSDLAAFLIIFGLFIVPLTAFVYLVPTNDERRTPALPLDKRGSRAVEGTNDEPASQGSKSGSLVIGRWSLVNILPWLTPALLLIGLLIGFPLLALLGLGLLAFSLALQIGDRPAESFALLVLTLGCAIVFGTEIIYIRDTFEGWSARFNTIFKFYYQVWLLWGTITPFALWYVLTRTHGIRRIIGGATTAIFALLLVGAGVYPALALRDLGLGPVRGLHAATPREQTTSGQAAINWLRENAAPGSVILEAAKIENPQDVAIGATPACGGSYNGEGYAGVSVATGLPTILGWVGHEQQWRGGDPTAAAELTPRCADVTTIYSTTDLATAQQLLEKYGVRYVYVGGLERATYPAAGLAKFEQIGTPISFGQDEVLIYIVP